MLNSRNRKYWLSRSYWITHGTQVGFLFLLCELSLPGFQPNNCRCNGVVDVILRGSLDVLYWTKVKVMSSMNATSPTTTTWLTRRPQSQPARREKSHLGNESTRWHWKISKREDGESHFFFQRKVQPSVLLPLFDAIITLAFYHFNSFLAVCSHRWPNKPCVPLCLRWEAKHVTSRAFTVESFSFENRIS